MHERHARVACLLPLCKKGLADGGNVMMPFGATFWNTDFGMLTDRFGIGWMVNAPHQ
ncbi:hypothetical protein KQH60_11270 [Mycetohabitans sp. B8]|nr:hypothetical protein [Mycetohabitans sp. B8]